MEINSKQPDRGAFPARTDGVVEQGAEVPVGIGVRAGLHLLRQVGDQGSLVARRLIIGLRKIPVTLLRFGAWH